MWDSKGENQKETKQIETRSEDVQHDRESWRHTVELSRRGREREEDTEWDSCWTNSPWEGERRKRRGGDEGRGVGLRGRDSYSRAEGPPSIIFKPLQPTLELVEIKHRITGISTSVPATTTPQTDSHGRTDGWTDRWTDRRTDTNVYEKWSLKQSGRRGRLFLFDLHLLNLSLCLLFTIYFFFIF